jgi:hypothetical protein
MDKSKLTENEKARLNNINYVVGGIGMLGAIGGIIYAKKTGGGFWRYVGYWIAGGLVLGLPARLTALPFKNKILKEADKRLKETTIPLDNKTKDVLKGTSNADVKNVMDTIGQIPSFKILDSYE